MELGYFLLLSCIILLLELAYANIHGGTFLAMAGKNSVVIASDTRFSSHQTGSLMIGSHSRQIFRIGNRIIVGSFGLDSDAISVMDHVRNLFEEYEISEDDLNPHSVTRTISDKLYMSNLMCSPIVVGLTTVGIPYLCALDGLGAISESNEFVVVGTATSGLYAICEALYRPNLPAEKLVALVETCVSNALERDVLSGGNIQIYTITLEGIFMKSFMTSDV